MEQKQRDEAWREYVAESLLLMSENTAKIAGGMYMSARWSDILSPKPVETRTAQQVINQVMTQLREVK